MIFTIVLILLKKRSNQQYEKFVFKLTVIIETKKQKLNSCFGHFSPPAPPSNYWTRGSAISFPGFHLIILKKGEGNPEKLQDPTPNISQHLTEQISLAAVRCSCTFGWPAEAIVNNGS